MKAKEGMHKRLIQRLYSLELSESKNRNQIFIKRAKISESRMETLKESDWIAKAKKNDTVKIKCAETVKARSSRFVK